jgi:primosomal protein N' (replication factor Y)
MATPLKLKSERVGKITLVEENPYLSVLVDTGVLHLDHAFDYSLPAKFDVGVGDWVSVPFNGRNCLGLVTGRSNSTSVSKVSPINRTAKGPKLSAEHISLYKAAAKRWAVPIFDVLRFVTKYRDVGYPSNEVIGSEKRVYLQLPAGINEIEAVKKVAMKAAKNGPTLLIIPESRQLNELQGFGFDVGMRGAALAPSKYVNLIVLREESEHHFEIKSPGFNTRDVALLRNEHLKENLIFVGYSPSLEMARLIDIGYIDYQKSSGRVRVNARPALQGELIPSALVKDFRSALSKGSILVIAPAKGYGLAISCASCRNIARCKCGGKLSKTSKSAIPSCVICSQAYAEWKCSFCSKEKVYLIGKGIERIAEEFGKSFSGAKIHIATADKLIEGEIPENSIVIATLGAAPICKYAAVLFLEGISLGSDLRSEERYLSSLFRYAALADANVMVVERQEHPAINSLIKWNPLPYLNRTLHDLSEAELPPSSRHALIKSDDSERIYGGLITAQREGRIPAKVRIHHLSGDVISVFFSLKDANLLLAFLYEFQKRRSMSGKPLLRLRIDPYLLG